VGSGDLKTEKKGHPLRSASRAVLGALLVLLVARAAFYERVEHPGPGPGEGTVWMQAQSLANDRDLAYTRADFDRAFAEWGSEPADLEIVRGDRLSWAAPLPYALYLAPFLHLSPVSGPALANAFLLLAAALAALLALERRVGQAAGLVLAVAIFGSVVFAHVFLVAGQIWRLFAVVLALALAWPGPEPAAGRGRWLAAGGLVALAAALEPLDGVLALGLLLSAPGKKRGLAFAAGFAVVLALQFGALGLAAGGVPWQSATFTPAAGFPLVDFPAEEWGSAVGRLETLETGVPWSRGLSPSLLGWNLVHLLFGQHLGLLLYFPPLLFFLAAGLRRRAMVLAALWVLTLLLTRPFELAGSSAAVGCGLFVPVFGASWWLARKRPHPAWALAVLVPAVFFLMPLWQAPTTPPRAPDFADRHVSELARHLPWESSQRGLPGGPWAELGDLRLRVLEGDAWVETRHGRVMVRGAEPVVLLVASPSKPEGFVLNLTGVLDLENAVQRQLDAPLLPPGHPMWWTRERLFFSRLRFDLAETLEATGRETIGLQIDTRD